MNRRLGWGLSLVLSLASCSKEPAGGTAKKAAAPPDQVQGKLQVAEETSSSDRALNAGGPSLFLRDGVRRYRLFLKAPIEVVPNAEYLAQGVFAQKAIEEIGDPDKSAKNYPLASSCERVVKRAWGALSFEVVDAHASLLRSLVGRYPARPIFLVTSLTQVQGKESKEEDKDGPTIVVTAEKQKAMLTEQPPAPVTPMWAPKGGTAKCKVVIDDKGKVSDLDTGVQLCEAVNWGQYTYKPTMQAGKAMRVKTEVEVVFEPRT